MARYTGPREKIERRVGAKLFLKGERSFSNKSAVSRRPYPPGAHGKNFRGRLSEFGQQLRSKQRVRNTYRMLERQFANWVKLAIDSKQETGEMMVRRLETRLDNTVYRLGIGQSRDQSRQLVNHGHIRVNDKKVSIPSYEVKVGDVISVRPGSMKTVFFSTLINGWIKKYETPRWLELNKETIVGRMLMIPTFDQSGLDIKDIQAIIEFYSR